MKRIYICSPYSGDIEVNVARAKIMCKIAMEQGFAPFAPHLIYPLFLDDQDPKERGQGIACGAAYMDTCQAIMIAIDHCSKGMAAEIEAARIADLEEIALTDAEIFGEGKLSNLFDNEILLNNAQYRHDIGRMQKDAFIHSQKLLNGLISTHGRIIDKLGRRMWDKGNEAIELT